MIGTAGLVTEVSKNNVPLVQFVYNERNHRMQKKSFGPSDDLVSSTYYVRDVSGHALAIHSVPAGTGTSALEHPVYGNGRIGVHKRFGSSGVTDYEITDHLGNVRTVFGVADNTMGNRDFSDYYPGGMAMPNRNVVGDYRYSFQGQEKDSETGKVAFELRIYDPRIN